MRGPLIAGVDVSSVQLNVALLPLDPTIQALAELRTRRIPGSAKTRTGMPSAERARYIRKVVHELLVDADDGAIESVFVEQPPPEGESSGGKFGGHDTLVETFGAVVASVPLRIDLCASLYPQVWRSKVALERLPQDKVEASGPGKRATWKPNAWKRAAIARVRDMEIVEFDWPLTDHEADACLLAVAGRYLHWKHHDELRLKEAAA